jgi:hypothetical protein
LIGPLLDRLVCLARDRSEPKAVQVAAFCAQFFLSAADGAANPLLSPFHPLFHVLR